MNRRPLALPVCLFLALLGCATAALSKDRLILSEDDASTAAYREGWKSDGGGTGFGAWAFSVLTAPEGETHAGFFPAEAAKQPELKGAAIRGRAFGLFANGVGFEVAAAFRPIKRPLAVGQTFSFLMENGTIAKKFDRDDPGTGAIGLTLRTGQAAGNVDDYNRGARFEFGAYEGTATYQIFDGEAEHDSGIPLTNGGLSISVTLITADTYDLEVANLADGKITTLKGRKLGGTAGAALESFCIFDRDGESSDAFFNGFQISGESE
jgi:hypothetical protein